MTNHARPGPLAGVRVLEFGQIAAGPFAGSLLADLGADVVKVEKPGRGDGIRYADRTGRLPPEIGGLNFQGLNRNKRGITIDIGTVTVGEIETLNTPRESYSRLVQTIASRVFVRQRHAAQILWSEPDRIDLGAVRIADVAEHVK